MSPLRHSSKLTVINARWKECVIKELDQYRVKGQASNLVDDGSFSKHTIHVVSANRAREKEIFL